MNNTTDTIEGYLEVGIDPKTFDVVVNHPDLKPDENGVGHIVFSPDQAIALSETLRRKAEEAWLEKARAAPVACHALRWGFPLCGFAHTFPIDWPEGHTWVGMNQLPFVTCGNCLAAAQSFGQEPPAGGSPQAE